jgi:hypothetical protein
VRLCHVRQQRLLGSVAIDRDLLELQAGSALQRWMRCSCCAQYVRQPRPMQSGRAGRPCARPPHRPQPYRQKHQHLHVARARACMR